jgi:lysophospholipid acyltransferase (LPLAT)-like uncharacterized protein
MTRARRLVRRVLRSSALRTVLCWAMHLYIRFVYATNRWVIEGEEWPRRLRGDGRAFIGTFWHGRMMMIPMGWQRLAPMHMLISAHRDGRIIAEAIAYFGVQSISGSTQRGGSAALRRMLKRLNAGECVGITPDGPRGPATTVSSGIINLARLADAPIVPIVCATSRRKVLNSWDRFNRDRTRSRGGRPRRRPAAARGPDERDGARGRSPRRPFHNDAESRPIQVGSL